MQNCRRNHGNQQVCHTWFGLMFIFYIISFVDKDRYMLFVSLFLSKTDASNCVYELLPTYETTTELIVRRDVHQT